MLPFAPYDRRRCTGTHLLLIVAQKLPDVAVVTVSISCQEVAGLWSIAANTMSTGHDAHGLSSILSSNHSWASKISSTDPSFFPTLSKGQSPAVLWLGCSDSRVPETTVLGLKPGDVFTHRNIANILPATDVNSLAVIEYAVVYLKVQHIVVCGHTSCGGVAAALGNKRLGKIDTWLMPLRQLRMQNAELLESLSESERPLKMVELNVRQGVKTLRENPDVIEAAKNRGLEVHGMIYDLSSGELKRLETGEAESLVAKRQAAFQCA